MITPRSVSGIEVRKKKLGEIRLEQLKRQQTIGPIIGSLIADHCLDRCHLKDEICDQIHALLYASADNLRRLARVIVGNGQRLFSASAPHHATDTHAEHTDRGWEQERRSQFLVTMYPTGWA